MSPDANNAIHAVRPLVRELLSDQLLAEPPQLLSFHLAGGVWSDGILVRVGDTGVEQVTSIVSCMQLVHVLLFQIRF